MPEQTFDEFFKSAYDRVRTSEVLAKAAKTADMRENLVLRPPTAPALGHPDFEYLEVGQTAGSQGVVLFLDIRGFTQIYWVGEANEIPPGVTAEPLRVWILYPEAFPATAPDVAIISPEISTSEVGHEWHRWPDGDICIVRPRQWQMSTTADEVIEKITDWYFNYVAKKAGLIDKMPDVGRAQIPAAPKTDLSS